jgi:AcrR family transcriptional regulator
MSKLTRDAWLVAAFELLADGGIDAVRVEPLAARLHVTKGSFYHHFDDRSALHLAMLEAWERAGTDEIIATVERAGGDPLRRISRLARTTMGVDSTSDGIETAIRAWAGDDALASAAAQRVDDRRLRYVEDLLVATGMRRSVAARRSRLFYRVLIGEYVWRASGAAPITDREVDEVMRLLLSNS